MSKRERRFFQTEVRASKDGKPSISGYAAVFGQATEIVGARGNKFRETIAPGAFSRAIAEKQDVRCLFNHDANYVLGRSKSGTLTLSEDDKGMAYDCAPPDSEMARGIVASIARGDVDGASFGFSVPAGGDQWSEARDENGKPIKLRTITDADLYDLGPVTFPAYEGASAEARSAQLFPEGAPDAVSAILEQRAEAAPTKKVDGKELHASDFAHVGDPADPSTWKFPIHDAAHVRNALARFAQAKGLSQAEKDAAYKKIVAAAKKFDIKISEENSQKLYGAGSCKEARAILRTFDPDGDGDDDSDLIDCLIDTDNALFAVHTTLGGVVNAVFNGEPAYTNPLLEALVKQFGALMADMQECLAECAQELAEPPAADDGGEMNSATTDYDRAVLQFRAAASTL